MQKKVFYEHVRRYRKREHCKKYYQNNKESRKEYNQKHKESRKEYSKKYHQKHKEDNKKRYQKNKEFHKEYNKKWRKNNPEKRLKNYLKYMKKLALKCKVSLKVYKYAIMAWSKFIHTQKYCQVCYSKDGLNAHHLLFKGFYPELSLIPTNGMLLCKSCHKEAHDLNPRPYLSI